MNDTIVKRLDHNGDAGISPEAPISVREPLRASGLYVIRALGAEQAATTSRRGVARSWIPGAWGDPF